MSSDEASVEFLDSVISHLNSGWTQNAYSRNHNGEGVASCDPTAVCWCAQGAQVAALSKTTKELTGEQSLKIETLLSAEVRKRVGKWQSLITYNDTSGRTAEDVVSVFEAAKIGILNVG